MRYLNLKLPNTKLMLTHLKPHSSDPSEHDHGSDFQITIPITGEPFLELNKKSNHLNQHVRMVTAPGEKHLHFTGKEESKILLINVNKEFIENVVQSKLKNRYHEIVLSSYGEGFTEKLVKVADEMIKTNLFRESNDSRTAELEWELAETLLSVQNGSHSEYWREEVVLSNFPVIKKVVEFIYSNYQTDFSLEDLSRESNMSKFYLIRTFKTVMGRTPSQYVLNVRLNRAIELLLCTNLDITTISFEVGFKSLNSFERAFKKQFGSTISQFRKNHKK